MYVICRNEENGVPARYVYEENRPSVRRRTAAAATNRITLLKRPPFRGPRTRSRLRGGGGGGRGERTRFSSDGGRPNETMRENDRRGSCQGAHTGHGGLVNRTKSYIQSSNVVRTMFKDHKREG